MSIFAAVALLGLIKFTWLPSQLVATNMPLKQQTTANKSAENLVDVNRTNNGTLMSTDQVTTQTIVIIKVEPEPEAEPANSAATNSKNSLEQVTSSVIQEDVVANTLVQERPTEQQDVNTKDVKK